MVSVVIHMMLVYTEPETLDGTLGIWPKVEEGVIKEIRRLGLLFAVRDMWCGTYSIG